ncbi:ATP synthase subunit delta, mitochondrial [Elysia marginata]|uniref:F-ATPase delta subunit n=1 Tax=Elysia marginata TaxID=1093978 RepID=A0AAV4F0E6_9GAST|nr:ATP synthase subunit delta, mitochondrial [Elysia marginata]
MAASVLRQVARVPILAQQCSRLFAASHRGYADMAFTFASPYDVYYKDAKVKQIDVPTFSGNFGILPDHVPTLAVLKPGVINVTEEDGSNKKYFVSSGSVTINDDSSIQILAEEAHPVDRLDAAVSSPCLLISLIPVRTADRSRGMVVCYNFNGLKSW